jgi:hypothetical protein
MNYAKPEVAILGDAVSVIESIMTKPPATVLDGTKHQNPAYDLDE